LIKEEEEEEVHSSVKQIFFAQDLIEGYDWKIINQSESFY
jgi:hypothetical protein